MKTAVIQTATGRIENVTTQPVKPSAGFAVREVTDAKVGDYIGRTGVIDGQALQADIMAMRADPDTSEPVKRILKLICEQFGWIE